MPGTLSAQTMAGTAISISAGLPATDDIIGFAALSYTLIAKLTDFDNIPSRDYTPVSFIPLDTREEERAKGSFIQADITANAADVQGDPGQEICKTAANSDDCFSFRVIFQNGDTTYFKGLVSSFIKQGGDANTIINRVLTVLPAGDTVEVLVSGILTASINAGGTYTGVTAGSFTATQQSTSGSGVGAIFTVTLAAGAVSAIELIQNSGFGYVATDTITLDIAGGPVETIAAVLDVDTVLAAA